MSKSRTPHIADGVKFLGVLGLVIGSILLAVGVNESSLGYTITGAVALSNGSFLLVSSLFVGVLLSRRN